MRPLAITTADIRAAAARLAGVAVRTPVLEFDVLNHACGGRVLIKPEIFQRSGSFKFRGAYNRLSALSGEERARGVVAFSSGNHAQGVALAAQLLGIQATIVMPDSAPAVKLAGTRGYGAKVVTYDLAHESREAIAADIAAKTGAIVVPSFDDPFIMAGQGTVGLELAQECAVADITPDQALFCCGGGGLSSGSFTALKETFPDIACYTVEPEDFDDTARSLASGRREHNKAGQQSICDALLTPSPGELPFAQLKALGAKGLSVSDADVRRAVAFALSQLKMVVEPGGAVALAAALAGKVPTKGRITVLVLSGGNIDPAMLATIVAKHSHRAN